MLTYEAKKSLLDFTTNKMVEFNNLYSFPSVPNYSEMMEEIMLTLPTEVAFSSDLDKILEILYSCLIATNLKLVGEVEEYLTKNEINSFMEKLNILKEKALNMVKGIKFPDMPNLEAMMAMTEKSTADMGEEEQLYILRTVYTETLKYILSTLSEEANNTAMGINMSRNINSSKKDEMDQLISELEADTEEGVF